MGVSTLSPGCLDHHLLLYDQRHQVNRPGMLRHTLYQHYLSSQQAGYVMSYVISTLRIKSTGRVCYVILYINTTYQGNMPGMLKR